jgi:hypothetical protein
MLISLLNSFRPKITHDTVGVKVRVVVCFMNSEQSDLAMIGREDFKLESTTVNARRQLSAKQARFSSGLASPNAAKPAATSKNEEKDFIAIVKTVI